MEGRQPNRHGESLTPAQKRIFAVAVAVLVVVLGGVSAWAVSDPGSYGRSRNGCVNVVMPSSTGGAIMHECGGAARTLCRSAFTEHTQLAKLARPQCRLAGLAPGSHLSP
jgi:hypothetical protein